jgi:hypothetical protein
MSHSLRPDHRRASDRASGQPVVLADVAAQHDYLVHLSEVLDVGPVIALPLVGYSKLAVRS